MAFNEQYYSLYGKLDNKDTPCFLIGTSLGGIQAAYIATLKHMHYHGIIPVVPYFGLKDPSMLDKIRPIVQAMSKMTPNQKIQIKDYKKAKKHVQDWLNNTSNILGSSISPHNVVQNDLAMKRIREEQLYKKDTSPVLVIRAGQDTEVDNKEIQKYFEQLP